MSLIALPGTAYFSEAELTLQRGSMQMRSPYTGKRQVISLPYAVWYFTGKFIKMDDVDAAKWRAFLVDLDGMANTFKLPIPGAEKPTSNYSGPNGVSGGASTGANTTTMFTTGWTPNATVLKKGDYFNVQDELKVVTADVVANGAGSVTISFKPPLRKAVPAATAVTVSNPYILLAAADDEQARWKLSKPVIHDIEIRAVEAF